MTTPCDTCGISEGRVAILPPKVFAHDLDSFDGIIPLRCEACYDAACEAEYLSPRKDLSPCAHCGVLFPDGMDCNWVCEICGKGVCQLLTCVAVVWCQRNDVVCRSCFDGRCVECGTPGLPRGRLYCGDEPTDQMPLCESCMRRLIEAKEVEGWTDRGA